MRLFNQLSIRKKLTLAIISTSIATLLLPAGAILSYEMIQLRKTAAQELATDSEIIAANSAAAIAFQDHAAAEEILSALKARSYLEKAVLFDASGDRFAEYDAEPENAHSGHPELRSQPAELRFEKGFIVLSLPIRLGEDTVGSLSVLANLRHHYERLWVCLAVLATAMFAAVFVAVLLSIKFQRVISDPILSLAHLANKVTIDKDYSLRAKIENQDEVGTLVSGFNEMLAVIEARDRELNLSEERFRQLAESINQVFWMSDLEKTSVLYLSPGYEKIWGRSRESMLRSPSDWMDAIHPDDRERIRTAVVEKQKAGTYDEEFRIIRPDGSVRWIRDRAFPIYCSKGNVYRLAGLAEDITQRKLLEKQVLEISDREQSRLGQDLHDGLCQHLVRIGFASNLLCEDLATQCHPGTARAQQIAQLVDESITQARNLARGLYPVKLETEGLQSALAELALTSGASTEVHCEEEPNAKEKFRPIDYSVAVHLYRIAHEAVMNALKHSKAKRIRISFSQGHNHLSLTISDDGVGFGPEPSSGMGLHLMKYRARMIGADFQVESAPGKGAKIHCRLKSQERIPSVETSFAL